MICPEHGLSTVAAAQISAVITSLTITKITENLGPCPDCQQLICVLSYETEAARVGRGARMEPQDSLTLSTSRARGVLCPDTVSLRVTGYFHTLTSPDPAQQDPWRPPPKTAC